MKNLIVVLLGGISGEREISFLTGKACSNALKKKGYKVKEVDAKGNFVKDLKIEKLGISTIAKLTATKYKVSKRRVYQLIIENKR